MFYKGHVIRDTSQNPGKFKGQRLVAREKIRDIWNIVLCTKSKCKILSYSFRSIQNFAMSIHDGKEISFSCNVLDVQLYFLYDQDFIL